MKQSARAKRLARHHRRLAGASKLNLVSLMDIFTILVFFLIVNQSEVRVLQNAEQLNLPVSIADELPTENIVVSVFDNRVMVQERAIWRATDTETSSISESLTVASEQQESSFIDALKAELAYQASKRPELTEQEQQLGRAVTILGDAGVEYRVLKQIMAVCAEANFRNMSLAVEQIAASDLNASASGTGG